MPLLRRQPFVPNAPPSDLQPNEEVFYCPLTKEVFKDFEAFFERTILCNSLLWSCSLTGKTNLTFQEAIDSEKRALLTVSDVPFKLKQPLLYIASLTCRGKVNDACDDVYYFMKDRYFVHEHLEAILRGKWYPAEILRVVPPTASEVEKYTDEKDEDLSTDDKLMLLNQYGPPPELLKYEVKELMGDNEGVAAPIHMVTVDCVRREKRLYSREKVRLYLRHCMEFDEFQGIWIVKPEAWKKLKLESISYADIFIPGPRPTFEVSRAVKKVSRTSAQVSKGTETPKTPTSRVNGNSTPVKGTPKRTSQSAPNAKSAKSPKYDAETLTKEFIKIREERETLRQFADRRKQQKLEEKQLAKEKKKEEKRAMAEYVKEWSKQRDDLECDDLKDLPTPTPVQCRIPNSLFGDFLMVLEFFHCFGEELQLKDNFPAGLTYDLLERAVIESEVCGPLSDILQVLLTSLFEYQDAEAEEVKEANSGDQQDQDVTESGPTYQGTPLKKLSMDSLTVSEILRLHLVSSGGRSSEIRSKWRYQQRGGYSSADDPGVQLRDEDPHILHMLATNTVYELAIGEKLKVIKCLCHQILTYASIRDVLEEKSSRLLQVRQEMRALHSNERRMRREDAAKKAKIRATEENGCAEGESQVSASMVSTSAEMDELEKEGAKRKAEYIKKEQHLRLQVTRLQSMTHFMPLGQDRAFRRFWVFESCPGLFVEDDDDFVGACLPHPTPSPPSSQNLTSDSAKNKEDIRSFFKASNKENQVIGNENISERSKIFGVCTANPSDCPVHATYIPRTKWAFYENVESVDNLLASLNDRGFRESALKHILLQDKERISESIQKCAVHRLDHSKPDIQQQIEVRKSTRQTRKEKEYDINMHFPPGTPVEQILERTFIDMILETEEKIFVGGLGALKVKDRNAWRQGIEDGKYDPLVDSVAWGGKLETKPRIKTEFSEIEEEDNGSVISSSVDGETLASVVPKKNVMDMSTALLQLAQSVETKYLRKPLGEDEREKKKRLKAEEALKKWEDQKEATDSTKMEPKVVRTPLEKWELSLHACTSFSQLYVHLALLDNSITWNRSALNARCRICRRKGDAEKMLLCDGCDKGHHMYCLRPPLTVVPDGDWFCYECKPREKPRTPKKTRRVFSEVSDDEDQEEEEENADAEEEAEAEEGESEVESIHNETCAVCQEGGNVLCCDTCPAVYHLECVNPPLRKVPRGKWSCPQCKTPPQEKERIKLREKNSDGRTSASRSTRARQILDFDNHEKEDIKYPATRQRTQTDPIRLKASPDLVHGKRRSATEAVDKIAQATKRLRGESYDDESSGGSDNHKWSGPPRNRRNRPLPLPSSSVETGVVDMGDLEHLVTDLMKHPDSWPFRKPVTKAEAPDYHRVIKQAMDLGTIKYKLNTMKYQNTEEFLDDLLLIFQNCFTYNNENADEYKCGKKLNQFTSQRLKQLGFNKGVENSS